MSSGLCQAAQAPLPRRGFHPVPTRLSCDPVVRRDHPAFPTNPSYRIYSSFVFGNDAVTIQKITSTVRDEMKAFRAQFSDDDQQQVLLEVTWIHGGGKATKKRAAAATASQWRGGT
jgi:hypothetical protein